MITLHFSQNYFLFGSIHKVTSVLKKKNFDDKSFPFKTKLNVTSDNIDKFNSEWEKKKARSEFIVFDCFNILLFFKVPV
jgi:hypothetical protein